MKKLCFLHLLFTVNALLAQNLVEVENFGTNPGNLKMFTYNTQTSKTEKHSLVVVLHGCGQNAQDVAELTGWNKLAQQNNFMLVYPQQKFINNPSLCFNWFRNNDIEKDKGECKSIQEMIAYAISNCGANPDRVYVTGLSAGASMSVALLASYPTMFKGGAVFAGGAYKIATNTFGAMQAMLGKSTLTPVELAQKIKEQNPKFISDYPFIIVYQGLNDKIVNPKNATLLVGQWATINKMDTLADTTENTFMGVNGLKRMVFINEAKQNKVILYEVDNLGHEILINPGDNDNEGGKKGIFGVDLNYHSTHQTAKEFELIDNKSDKIK